ncbi:MAG: dipeptidase [Myxococcota bacterium]
MKRAIVVGAACLVLLPGVFVGVPAYVENDLNRVLEAPLPPPSERAVALHQKLLVADLHADSLLWNRDLLGRASRGHADLPRLREGNVALQGLGLVTKTPRGQNIESNDDSTDNILLLSLVQLWPPRTWLSLKERALYQAAKLHDLAARSDGGLTIIRTGVELRAFLERRARDPSVVATFLGVEGAHALEGEVQNVDALFEAGVRMMSPAHFFDTDMGGSAHGVERGGLTGKGREMIRRMEARKMLVDLAHASHQAVDDVLAMATRPVLVSHTGVKGTCDNNRNLSDEHLRAIARTGGVVGVGLWETATCGTDARAVARAMRHVANVVGVQHVGLGTDFDGAVTTPFDVSGLVHVTDALLAEGFSDEEIAQIMGGNILRVLQEQLP